VGEDKKTTSVGPRLGQ